MVSNREGDAWIDQQRLVPRVRISVWFDLFFFISMTTTLTLQPHWVVGFCDAESNFYAKERENYIGFRQQFSVSQHLGDARVLYAMQAHFGGCGQITLPKAGGTPAALWCVADRGDLTTRIVPFFEKHPLQTKRSEELQRFGPLCVMLHSREYRSSPEKYAECQRLVTKYHIKFGAVVVPDNIAAELTSVIPEHRSFHSK